jgi:REP element-mobilizing transposase RayT
VSGDPPHPQILSCQVYNLYIHGREGKLTPSSAIIYDVCFEHIKTHLHLKPQVSNMQILNYLVIQSSTPNLIYAHQIHLIREANFPLHVKNRVNESVFFFRGSTGATFQKYFVFSFKNLVPIKIEKSTQKFAQF